MARASLPEKDRVDFYLYVDEFHNLVTQTFENLFSEARKYGLCLIVAHQYMSQLLPGIMATVLGNSGTIVIFRIGGDDARRLESEMTPIFKAKDMINLGMQEFYIKMTIDGNTYDPFSAETLKIMPATHRSFKEEILNFSRETYAIGVEEVKKKLEEEEKELLFGKKGKKEEDEAPASADLPAGKAGVSADKPAAKEKEGPAPMV